MTDDARRVEIRFNLILFTVFALIGLGGYAGFAHIRGELLGEQIAINTFRTDSMARRVDQWLATRKAEVATLANTPALRSMDWAQSGPLLKAKHERMPWFYIFAHINPDGTYYNSKVDFAKGQNIGDRAHVRAALSGRVYASDPVNSRTLGVDIVAVTSPIFQSDAKDAPVIGAFGGMIDTSTIVEELDRFDNGPGSYAFAVNSTGVAIAHPDPARRGNINTNPFSLAQDADPGLAAAAAAMLKGSTGWLRATVDGRDVYVHHTPLAQAQWFIATVTDAQVVHRNLRLVDAIGAAALLLLCAAMAMVVRFRRIEVRTVNQQRALAEEKSRAKTAFLANVSHELRTPLNGILGYSQILLQRETTDETSRRHLQIIQSSGQHLLSLINRILDLAKIEAGRVELEPRPVDLPALLQDLTRVFEIERARHGAGLRCGFAPDLPRTVRLDPDKFRQVVTNVVVNAFKYGERSEVVLSVTRSTLGDRPSLRIEVRDAGRGMTPDEIRRAFTPFEQVRRGAEGAGLGLAIVHQLLELMGGSVTIDSEPGRGTCVVLEMPFEEADQTVPHGPDMRLPRGVRDRRPSLLVVDDNAVNVSLLVDLLQPRGFEVHAAHSVDEALASFAAQRVDLVVTDLVMPDRDGFDLIRAIRSGARAPDTPIVVASASAFAGDQVRSAAVGADRFLAKPVDSAALLQVIADLLHLEYHDSDEPEAAAPPAAEVAALRAVVLAQPVAERIREAAELGQLMRIESLIDEVPDEDLRRALHRLLDAALREQDADRVLEVLDGGPAALGAAAGREMPA
jgi:signal transduction histidine kinase/DNA-binding response OmpR family regulator